MDKNQHTALQDEYAMETTEELVGVLTAISLISKRMARKLLLLEQRTKKGGEKQDGKPPATHAD